MARLLIFGLAIVIFSLSEVALAEPSYTPSLFFPIEHRADALQKLSDEEKDNTEKVSLDDYELQIVPNDQFDMVEYDTSALSILGLLWNLVPSPIAIFKGLCLKVWKVIKFLMPLNLIALGMALVVGFCAFTPYCTLIIEKPFVLQYRSISENIPYLDEVQDFFSESYIRLRDMQI